MSDFCPTKELNGAYVQENKWIRNHKGYLIGRLTDTVSYESEHIVSKEPSSEEDKQVIENLKDALKVFADYFEGDLKNIGGGTRIMPAMTMQPFKDAKRLLNIEGMK